MRSLRAVGVGLALLAAAACPPDVGPSDAGPLDAGDDRDAGVSPDAGNSEVCDEVPTTCEPSANQTPLDALDRCFVCARGLCRIEGGEEVCGTYDDPHPVFCAGVNSPLPPASDEDGERPLIASATIRLPELNPPTCADGFLWSLLILRVPGAPAVAHVAIGDAPAIALELSDLGQLVEDGVPRLLSVASATVCLDLGPDDPLSSFSIQLEDDSLRRSPRYCGELEVRFGEDGGG